MSPLHFSPGHGQSGLHRSCLLPVPVDLICFGAQVIISPKPKSYNEQTPHPTAAHYTQAALKWLSVTLRAMLRFLNVAYQVLHGQVHACTITANLPYPLHFPPFSVRQPHQSPFRLGVGNIWPAGHRRPEKSGITGIIPNTSPAPLPPFTISSHH